MLEKIEPMEFIEDDEIIRLFHERKREQEAFRLLVNKYKERLYWHIRKIVINHDDTDDLLQNVFVKIWQGLQEFRNDSKLYTWMYRIATNESLNFLNEKSRKVYGNSDEISVYLENTDGLPPVSGAGNLFLTPERPHPAENSNRISFPDIARPVF